MSSPDFKRLLEHSDVEVNLAELDYLDDGFSSQVYATGSHVVKLLSHRFDTWLAADTLVDVLYAEQMRIGEYLGEGHLALAKFVVGQESRGYRLSLVQDRVEGLTMQEALSQGLEPAPFLEYLMNGLKMYKQRREIPDLGCLENGFFNPLIDPNTKVVIDEEGGRPVLVDTTFGRTQRRRVVGSLFHAGIARGAQRAIRSIS